MPPGTRSLITVFVALIFGGMTAVWALLVPLVFGASWWFSPLILGAGALLALAAKALFTNLPPRQVRLQATFTPNGVRWNHNAGYLRVGSGWRQAEWRKVAAIHRLRAVQPGPNGLVEHNWAGIVFEDGTWTPVPVAVRRDFWFSTFAEAHHVKRAPWDIDFVGFDAMPPFGAPVSAHETLPADRQVDVYQSHLPHPL